MLIDNHGRVINYLRLAVTDRCNLRCFYCMPEEGIEYVRRDELMSFEEMIRITKLFASQGISKIRITGGEPFLRKDLMEFLDVITSIPEIEQVSITTNGTLLRKHIPELKRMGVRNINLSLDSLDAERFRKITRRDNLSEVLDAMDLLVDQGFKTRVNAVVMAGKNTQDIIPMVELGRNRPISIRFIEEMPFNGTEGQGNQGFWSYVDILDHIRSHFPNFVKLNDGPSSTSMNYQIEGFQGSFGIIAAYSRTFCGTCNRLRLTPQGTIRTCLYDQGVFNIKTMMRQGATDQEILVALQSALNHRAKDGFEAERNRIKNFPVSESMATIGG
ncbi:MAG: GTP 3',8-cyclase MoaA [Saprospiraceae bacterium]|nr:GTP 3',8-cyclase MoaA [Saprospiraceae bacterium]